MEARCLETSVTSYIPHGRRTDQRTPGKHRIMGAVFVCITLEAESTELVLEEALDCETTVLDFIPLSPSSMTQFSDFLQFSFFLVLLYFVKKVFSVAKCVRHRACVSFPKPNWNQIPSRTVGATAFLCYRNYLLLKYHCHMAPSPNENSANWCLVSTICDQNEKLV